MDIHGYEDSEIFMDIHGYPPKNGLDMDAIFHLHGKPDPGVVEMLLTANFFSLYIQFETFQVLILPHCLQCLFAVN